MLVIFYDTDGAVVQSLIAFLNGILGQGWRSACPVGLIRASRSSRVPDRRWIRYVTTYVFNQEDRDPTVVMALTVNL